MPLDTAKAPQVAPPQKVAIIGSGISGLSAAWMLSRNCDVSVYEKHNRLGGHSNTADVPIAAGSIPVDTGFIVFNEPSYPNLTAMLDHLGVGTEESCMSLGVSLDGGEVEYSGQTLSSVFARRSNAVRPSFWRMLSDIPRFHRDAKSVLRAGFCEQSSLGEFVASRNYGRGFRDYFLKPMASAIWSTPQMRILDYPALSFLQFFENHGLLRVLNLPVWHTVSGGSRAYVSELTKAFSSGVRLSSGVRSVARSDQGVLVTDIHGETDRFDAVVIASHANEALAMLEAPGEDERAILSTFRYQPNRAVLHFDEGAMPRRRRAWSSWNYLGQAEEGAVTYWMNRLQNLPCPENIFVTLNPVQEIDPHKIVATYDYDHPMFNPETYDAQREIWRLQGRGGIWYAGAHLGHGFHEDGLQAGLAVAEAIGGQHRPWRVENESSRLRMGAAAL